MVRTHQDYMRLYRELLAMPRQHSERENNTAVPWTFTEWHTFDEQDREHIMTLQRAALEGTGCDVEALLADCERLTDVPDAQVVAW